MRHVSFASILLSLALMAGLHPSAVAASPDRAQALHLTQRFEIAVGDRQPAVAEDRQLYVDGDKLALKALKSWLLIRRDLGTAWVMDERRHSLSSIPVARLSAAGAAMHDAVQKALPNPPPFTPTGESKTIAGLPCRIYHGSLKELTVEACLTRELPALHPFQQLFGPPSQTPGIPLELIITMQQPGNERVSITQRITRVTRGAIDPTIFAPPRQASQRPAH